MQDNINPSVLQSSEPIQQTFHQPPQYQNMGQYVPMYQKKKFSIKKLFAVIAALVVTAGIGTGGYVLYQNNYFAPTNTSVLGVSTNTYSSIFLENGQVYFGKISRQNDKEIVLTNVYYLQVNQQAEKEGEQPQPDLNLVKRSDSLHGPADIMVINMQHVLFTETLRSDSKVIQAIDTLSKQ